MSDNIEILAVTKWHLLIAVDDESVAVAPCDSPVEPNSLPHGYRRFVIDPYKIYGTFEEALDRAAEFDDIIDDIIYWDKFPPGLGLEYTMH
jgi:hypothetical protein